MRSLLRTFRRKGKPTKRYSGVYRSPGSIITIGRDCAICLSVCLSDHFCRTSRKKGQLTVIVEISQRIAVKFASCYARRDATVRVTFDERVIKRTDLLFSSLLFSRILSLLYRIYFNELERIYHRARAVSLAVVKSPRRSPYNAFRIHSLSENCS